MIWQAWGPVSDKNHVLKQQCCKSTLFDVTTKIDLESKNRFHELFLCQSDGRFWTENDD